MQLGGKRFGKRSDAFCAFALTDDIMPKPCRDSSAGCDMESVCDDGCFVKLLSGYFPFHCPAAGGAMERKDYVYSIRAIRLYDNKHA